MQVNVRAVQWLDRTIALFVASLMFGIAVGNVAYGESWVSWTFFFGHGHLPHLTVGSLSLLDLAALFLPVDTRVVRCVCGLRRRSFKSGVGLTSCNSRIGRASRLVRIQFSQGDLGVLHLYGNRARSSVRPL